MAVSSYRRACPELVEGLGHPLFHAEKPGQAAAESRKESPPLQFSFLNIKDTGHYQKKVAFDSIAVAASGGRGHLSRMIMSRMMCGRMMGGDERFEYQPRIHTGKQIGSESRRYITTNVVWVLPVPRSLGEAG